VTTVRSVPQMEPVYGHAEEQALTDYLRSGGWGTEFERTREFERKLAAYTGAAHCVVTTNGTIALSLGLMAMGIGPGDEVIVPDYTMIASATSVVLAGAKPVFVDVDPAHFCIDPADLRRALSRRTKAVMYVSINGRAPSIEAVTAFVREHGVALVEDAAQSLGSFKGGRHLGTIGHWGSFSFSVHKLVSTGNGGAVVTDSFELAERMRKLKDFGRQRAGVDLHETLGFNFKFTDIQAVIGLEQLRAVPERSAQKKRTFARYQELLADIDGLVFPETDLESTSPWFMDVLVEPEVREPLAAFLRQHNVGTRPFYPPVHTQAPFATEPGTFPGAVDASRRGLWLPSSVRLSDDDIQYVAACVRSFYTKSGSNRSA
jgi:perosamine synthetase